jgi:hypothetical protein
MRTTVRLDPPLLILAKEEAVRRGTTLTALIESGLRRELARPLPLEELRHVNLPVCTVGGGTLPGVDLSDTSTVMDVMEGLR